MAKYNILPGDRFGKLTVLSEAPPKHNSRFFHCRCECGNSTVTSSRDLWHGFAKSCGCLRAEKFADSRRTHGKSNEPIYKTWIAMKQRCFNNSHPNYKYYGGRGISICKEWFTFENFYNWAVENGYQDGLTIERKNNDGDYCPENCTWIPKSKQQQNTRKTIRVKINGIHFRSLKEAAKYYNVNYNIVCIRRSKGWSISKALGL